MNINDVRKGRIYQWVYNPPAHEWSAQGNGHLKVGGRAGTPDHDLLGRVTVRTVFAGQAADIAMYVKEATKRAAALGQVYTPSNRPPNMEQTTNPSVYRSLSSGEFQVAIINPIVRKHEYFVDGRPATEAEVATIEQVKKASKKSWIMFPYLDNLTNVEGGFIETKEDLNDWLSE